METKGNEETTLELGSVRDVMATTVVALRPEQSLGEAARELERAGVSGGPVVKEGAVLGVVTLGDLLRGAGVPLHAAATSGPWLRYEHSLDRSGRTVDDVMTKRPLTVLADEPLGAAAVAMCDGGVNRVPVLDRDHRIVGILARDDVVAAVARAYQRPDRRAALQLRPRMAPD
jgi:CBS domain-containing protein